MENNQIMEDTLQPENTGQQPQLDFDQDVIHDNAGGEVAPAPQGPVMAVQTDVVAQMQEWTERLENSEKGGFGKNSKYYNKVHDGMEAANQIFRRNFSNDVEQNKAILKEARLILGRLLGACLEYTARNPKTRNGKERKELVLQIKDFVTRDLLSCQDATISFIQMTPEEQSQQTWSNVLAQNRIETVQVADYSKLEKPGSGQASEVYMIRMQEGEQETTKYFKKEDSVNLQYMMENEKYYPWEKLAKDETFQIYPDLTEEETAFLKKATLSQVKDAEKISARCKKAYLHFDTRATQLRTTYQDYLKSVGLTRRGGFVNTTRRNVATNRMADLLGVGHLVARSRTVEVQDQATGKSIRGNLMDQALGVSHSEVKERLQHGQITSGFMRDALNLQILDALCGQGDRHMGNIRFQTDQNGMVSGLMGIDNDGSFGLNLDTVSVRDASRRDGRIFDQSTGEMVIPFMDDGMANRILNLDRELVRFALADLLTPDEVDTACLRLENMKLGIRRAKEKTPERFLTTEDAWSVTVADDAAPGTRSVATILDEQYRTVRDAYDAEKDLEEMKIIIRQMYLPEIAEKLILYKEDLKTFEKKYPGEVNLYRNLYSEVIRNHTAMSRKKYYANYNYMGRFFHES